MKSNIAWDGIVMLVCFDKKWGDKPFRIICRHLARDGQFYKLHDNYYSDKESVISTVEELIKDYEAKNFLGGDFILYLNGVELGTDQLKTELRNKNFEKKWRQPNKLEKVFLNWLHS